MWFLLLIQFCKVYRKLLETEILGSEFRVKSALNIFRRKHYSVSYFMKEWSRDGTNSFDFKYFRLGLRREFVCALMGWWWQTVVHSEGHTPQRAKEEV